MTSKFDLTQFYDVIIRNSVFTVGFLTREFQIPLIKVHFLISFLYLLVCFLIWTQELNSGIITDDAIKVEFIFKLIALFVKFHVYVNKYLRWLSFSVQTVVQQTLFVHFRFVEHPTKLM